MLYGLKYSGTMFFVYWKLKFLDFLMDFVLIIFKNSGNLKYLLSCFFFQADCLEEGEADLQVFMSVSNRREATEVKDIIATGKWSKVPKLVCG